MIIERKANPRATNISVRGPASFHFSRDMMRSDVSCAPETEWKYNEYLRTTHGHAQTPKNPNIKGLGSRHECAAEGIGIGEPKTTVVDNAKRVNTKSIMTIQSERHHSDNIGIRSSLGNYHRA